jgi:hypothetical protein
MVDVGALVWLLLIEAILKCFCKRSNDDNRKDRIGFGMTSMCGERRSWDAACDTNRHHNLSLNRKRGMESRLARTN